MQDPLTFSDVSAELPDLRKGLNGAKVRTGSRFLVQGNTLKSVPLIEVWFKEKRRYFPVSFNKGWYFATSEDRDKTLQALT